MRARSASFPLILTLLLVWPAVPATAQRATFASLAGATGLPVQHFDIDWPHSAIEFTVRFMGLSKVRGAFGDFGGTLMYDTADVSRSSISVVINAASINTNVASRDKDLKSPNFFDVEKYPRITFASESVEKTAEGFLVRGPLTMHGVTKEVAIPFTVLHPRRTDAWGNYRIGFVGAVTVSRKAYGILGTAFWNSEFDPGRMSISDDVAIDLTVEAEVNNVDRWDTPKGDSLRKVAETQGMAMTLEQFRAAARDTTTDAGRFPEAILGAAGTKLLHHKQFADALQVYRLAAELVPNHASVHAALGEAWLLNGNRSEAVASFRRAAGLDSTNTLAAEYLRYLGGR
jgi:polyisoprenoid-binding protein YceI